MKVQSNAAAKPGLTIKQVTGELILATVKEVATIRRDDAATGALTLHAGVLFTKTVKQLSARCQVDRLPEGVASKIRKVCQDFAGLRLETLNGEGWFAKREGEVRVKLNKQDAIHETKRIELARLCDARQQVKHGRFEIIRLKEMLRKADDATPKTREEKERHAKTVASLENRVKRWQDAVNAAQAMLNAASAKSEAKPKRQPRGKVRGVASVAVTGESGAIISNVPLAKTE